MTINNLLSNTTTSSSIGISGSPIGISSSSIGISGSSIGSHYPNNNVSFPNTIPYYGVHPYITNYDFDSKTIDIEKLMKIEEEKRKMLFDLFLNFLNCDNSNSKKIMYNTLESYNLIIEKKSLDRKVKIVNLTNG